MIRGAIEYTCPTCGKKVSVIKPTDLPTRPFCCFRCKMIDLYKWLNEEYYIPHNVIEDTEEHEN